MTTLYFTQILSRDAFEHMTFDLIGFLEDEIEHKLRSEAYRRKSVLTWPVDIHWIAEKLPSFPDDGYSEPWEKGSPLPDWALWLRAVGRVQIEEIHSGR
jgi:hypothetical protein